MVELSKTVFISYAVEDMESAKKLNEDLKRAGISTWFDKESLLPGQNWPLTIINAIKECRYFLTLLSSRSVTKRGFINKELKKALNIFEEFPESDIYIIPIRLDPCFPTYNKISELHMVDMYPIWREGINKILKVIKPNFLDSPIEEESLRKYLKVKFGDIPGIEHSFGNDDSSEIIQEIKDMGLNIIEDLDNIILPDYLLFFSFYHDRVNLSSIIRDILIIHYKEEYFNEAWKNHWTYIGLNSIDIYGKMGLNIEDFSKMLELKRIQIVRSLRDFSKL